MTAAKLALSKTHLILQSRTCNSTSVSNRIHGTEKERTCDGNGGFPESRSLASTNAGSASHTFNVPPVKKSCSFLTFMKMVVETVDEMC